MVRFKNRYILLEVHWSDGLVDAELPPGAVANAVRDSINSTFGDFGAAAAGRAVDIKYWNATTSLAIIRCTRSHFRMVWAGASFVSKIGNRQCAICAKHVGGKEPRSYFLVSLHFPPGTIRSCQRAIIKYNRRMLTSLGKEVPVTVEVEKDLSGSESIGEDDASDSGGEGEETEPIERKPEVPSLHCVRALTCLSSRWATLLPCRYSGRVALGCMYLWWHTWCNERTSLIAHIAQ